MFHSLSPREKQQTLPLLCHSKQKVQLEGVTGIMGTWSSYFFKILAVNVIACSALATNTSCHTWHYYNERH
jgi:hypothetical protein